MEKITKQLRQPMAPAGISWQQASDYCQWLGKQVGIPMNLPTEAQWEYAARNKDQKIHFPTNTGKIEDGINVWSYEQRIELRHKNKAPKSLFSEIGQFPPSALGFYDLITDNYEWMLDWYATDYYQHSPEKTHKALRQGLKKYYVVLNL